MDSLIEMVKDELYEAFGDESSRELLDDVVDYLYAENFFDYDTLKELYDDTEEANDNDD